MRPAATFSLLTMEGLSQTGPQQERLELRLIPAPSEFGGIILEHGTNMKLISVIFALAALSAAAQPLYVGRFVGDGPGITNLVNSSGWFQRSIRSGTRAQVDLQVASNAPIRFMRIGDSVTSNGETFRGLVNKLDAWMPRGGFGSTIGNLAIPSTDTELFKTYFFSGSGVSEASNDFHNYLPHLDLSNGQQITSGGSSPFGNYLSIYYNGGVGLGSMLVETQVVGGAFGACMTITSSVVSGSAVTNMVLPTREFWNLRITSTGSNSFNNASILDTAAQLSQAWASQEGSGALTMSILTNKTFWTIYTNYAPHQILVESKDTASEMLAAMQWASANLTNSSLVFVTPSPNFPDAGTASQAEVMARFCRTNSNIDVFDKWSVLNPTNFFFGIGAYSDGAHLSYVGRALISQAFAEWYGLDAGVFAISTTPRYPQTKSVTNVLWLSPFDVRLSQSGTLQTTQPVHPNEIFFGGGNLLASFYAMVSGAPRQIEAQITSQFLAGKKNIAVTQRWLTTNAQPISFNATFNRLNFAEVSRREKVGTSGDVQLQSATGTNLFASYRFSTSFSTPCRENDTITAELGFGAAGTLTNTIWWGGCKIEAW